MRNGERIAWTTSRGCSRLLSRRRRSPLGVAIPEFLLARDRLGIKPLYYALVDGNLIFASEVRSLLASGQVEPRLSQTALRSYLLFGSVVEPMTLVEGVYSLPPGHRIIISAAGRHTCVHPEPYWDFAASACPALDTKKAGTRLGDGVPAVAPGRNCCVPFDCGCARGSFLEQRHRFHRPRRPRGPEESGSEHRNGGLSRSRSSARRNWPAAPPSDSEPITRN